MLLIDYAAAVAQWTLAGCPTRTDQEVENIFRVFCKPCYLHRRGTCLECGCRVRSDGIALTNKIRMATQHCPIKRW